jgi:hypothetical protein
MEFYAILVGGTNGVGARRGMVAIVELIDHRPYDFQPAVYGRLIYTVMNFSERLLTQADPNLHLRPPPELRRMLKVSIWKATLNSVSEGLCTQGLGPGRTVGESVGGIFEMDCADWTMYYGRYQIRH